MIIKYCTLYPRFHFIGGRRYDILYEAHSTYWSHTVIHERWVLGDGDLKSTMQWIRKWIARDPKHRRLRIDRRDYPGRRT